MAKAKKKIKKIKQAPRSKAKKKTKAKEKPWKRAKENLKGEAIREIATETLDYFARTSSAAMEALKVLPRPSGTALIIDNEFTSQRTRANLAKMQAQNADDLRTLAREPAVARILVRDEHNDEFTYFICRASPILQPAISYRAPMGRVAAWPINMEDEIARPGGRAYFQLRERAHFRPQREGNQWDARNSVFDGQKYKSVTVGSLLELLERRKLGERVEVDEIDKLLAADRGDALIREGRQRTIIDKMALRDQPILDQFQDTIFRLPIDARIAVFGPPGSGKTTTLIKRLGLTLDLEHMKEYRDGEDLKVVAATHAGLDGHEASWIMFTPTELLKQYVKEAFIVEGIPASDSHIRTWRDHSLELGRRELRILRTGDGGGPFVPQPDLSSLQEGTIERQKEWFGDFEAWQLAQYWTDLRTRAELLVRDGNTRTADAGRRVLAIVDRIGKSESATTPRSIVEAAMPLAAAATELMKAVDDSIRRTLAQHAKSNEQILDEILDFLKKQEIEETPIDEGLVDEVESEATDDDDAARPLGDRERAFDSYTRAVKALARSVTAGRRLRADSLQAKLIVWLGERLPAIEELKRLGRLLQVEQATRFIVAAPRRLLFGVPARYRLFRRARQQEEKWYQARGFATHELGDHELDLIILAMLRTIRRLQADTGLSRHANVAAFLSGLRDLFRTQVVVDEVTDFSPIQIACMAALADPAANSFFACGDFNQRMTLWGARTEDDLRWMLDDLEIYPIRITYRHSRQLNEIARRIAMLSNPQAEEAQLPAATANDEVKPVLGRRLATPEAVSSWLRKRIVEIERLSRRLPSIAVLVNSEEHVPIVTAALNSALRAHSIRAVACRDGMVIGQEKDVRVFDIQHIKGLEFEAVFLVDVDRLTLRDQDVFDKYLYVAATRAATYLGMTVTQEGLPDRLHELEPLFQEDWSRV